MSESPPIPGFLNAVAERRHLLVPLAFLLMLGVLVVPMPPAIMDILISGNIALAAVVMMTTVYMKRPLDFSAFPAVLLAATLFRLVLNVASTRLILSAEASSPEAARGVAGQVILAFSQFVAGESAVVGVIIFIILVVVQFVVITKGATRMSEVAARFTLDAMPGKQMAIDADLSAGLIDEGEARSRRDAIMQEADFYGAMDGASKFVRGDAVAGIIITLVNIVGGFCIGMLSKGWSFEDSVAVFTLLTIGDGLVSQIPSFIIAIASGLIVARTNETATIGDEIPRQLASQPTALYLIGGFLSLLAFTPLPTLPLFGAGAGLASLAYILGLLAKREKQHQADVARQEAAAKPPEPPPVEELLGVDTLELEIGYGLVALVDASRGGDLLDRITMIRRQLAAEIGMVLPPVRIRDNMQLDANAYAFKLRGATVGRGSVYPELLMAMDSGFVTGTLDGLPGKEPAFGLDAIWIEPGVKTRAETMNYTVVDPTSVVATHITELVRSHADELLSREEVNHLVEELKKNAPKLVEEVIPSLVKPGLLQKVLQALLRERVPVRDLEVIVETLGDWATHTQDPDVLVEYVRNALRRTISHQFTEVDDTGRRVLYCITMDPAADDMIKGYIDRGPHGSTLTMPPAIAAGVARSVAASADALTAAGRPVIVLTSPLVRAQLRQILEPHVPGAAVLSYNEIVNGLDVESVALVQLSDLASDQGANPVMATAGG